MNTPFKGKWDEPSGVPDSVQDREASSCGPKPEFTSSVDAQDGESPSRDMFEILTQAVEMIIRWG